MVIPPKAYARTIKIYKSTVLTEDLGPFIETGLEICADNIVLDGAGHKIIGMGDGREQWGIYIDGKVNVTIKNVEVYGFQINIYVSGSYNIRVLNCTVHHNFPDGRAREGFYGIESKNSYNTLFMNNTIEYISDEGIHFSGSFGNETFMKNIVRYCQKEGVYLLESVGVRVLNNTFINCNPGIYCKSSGHLIANNTLINSSIQIRFPYASGNEVVGNILYGGVIRLEEGTNNNTVYRNEIQSSSTGIYLYGAENNIIHHNKINVTGIYGICIRGKDVYSSRRNHIYENTLIGNATYGIFIQSGSLENEIYGNIVANKGDYGIYINEDADSNVLYQNVARKHAIYDIYDWSKGARNNWYNNEYDKRNW